MTIKQAETMAAQHSRATGGRVFVCEHSDSPGSFCPVTEVEYYADPDSGDWFREAVAEYFNGERVAAP